MVRYSTEAKLLEGSILDEQIRTETEAMGQGAQRYYQAVQKAIDRGDGPALKPAERLIHYWIPPLAAEIRHEQRQITAGKPGPARIVYGPVLRSLPPVTLALITVRHVLCRCMQQPGGVKVVTLTYGIGRDVAAEINLSMLKRGDKETYRKLITKTRRLTAQKINRWTNKQLTDQGMTRRQIIHAGSRLLWALITTASIGGYTEDDFILAFHHQRRRLDKNKLIGYVKPDHRVLQAIDDGHTQRQFLRPRYQPMLVPPYPWTDDAQGGYVRIRTPFVAKPTREQKLALKEADLSRVNAALNAIGSIPWRINSHIYQIVKAVWEQGGGSLGVPHADNYPFPPVPAEFKTDPKVKRAWKDQAYEIHCRNVKLMGERSEFLQRLTTADRYLDSDFWLPHQLDFRGRLYPIPPHLNHHSNDLCRGLMEFARPRPLSKRGLWWLKIHVANCWGYDKESFADRVWWTDQMLDHIGRSVSDPIDYRWWQQAENPWQFLAACCALTDDERAARLPVQLDGSCNGLQHYSALGRDEKGAAQVNLLPTDRPSDVYSAVAEAVIREVTRDVEAGNGLATMLLDYVGRPTVKRVVMTSVYGVTLVGARKQIYDVLDQVGLEDKERYAASKYLSRITLDAVGAVCHGARAIMDWLRACGRLIVAEGDPICWTTPLGLPVIQPYRNWKTHQIVTALQKIHAIVETSDVPVAPGKQVDGLPPNFIHSIDATHLMMVTLACKDTDIDMVAVHDSFWTHAEDVDAMARILREQFIALHHQPLLEQLRAAWQERYPQVDFPQPPEPGRLDLDQVAKSEYAFA
jgi:DNA-directed RNA polymerase